MVAMMMAMLRNPRIVMFDEPTANLSPELASQVLNTIQSLARGMKIAILMVEQNAKRAPEMGNRAYLLVSGKQVFEGPAHELLTHKELSKLYLRIKGTDT
jgi:branched-chain amino acid transport system ATP-binding protein